ncbi:MAG: DUF6465 family protein [Oliverpabstia sp.]
MAARKGVTKTTKKPVEAKTEVAAEVKAPAKKASAKAPVKTQEVYVQFGGKEISVKDLTERVKDIWTKELGNKVKDMTDVKVYVKPEENTAYYVVNGDVSGSMEL